MWFPVESPVSISVVGMAPGIVVVTIRGRIGPPGIVVGIVQTLSICENIPVEWYSENDAKKALLQRKAVSKAEVIAEVERVFDMVITGPKYVQEAVADALAIYHVAELNSPTIKFMNR